MSLLARGGRRLAGTNWVTFEPEGVRFRVEVYDVPGRLVRRFVDTATVPGEHAVEKNAHDESGNHVPAGVYSARFVRRRAESIDPAGPRSIRRRAAGSLLRITFGTRETPGGSPA